MTQNQQAQIDAAKSMSDEFYKTKVRLGFGDRLEDALLEVPEEFRDIIDICISNNMPSPVASFMAMDAVRRVS